MISCKDQVIHIQAYNKSITTHYQKIDKYKRKYRGYISIENIPTDFTDRNICSVYTEGITVGNKIIKTKANSVGKTVGKL
jgi:hypothetical protein